MEARQLRVRQGASDVRSTSQSEKEVFHPIDSMEVHPANGLSPGGVDISESTYLGPWRLQSPSRRKTTPNKGTPGRKKRSSRTSKAQTPTKSARVSRRNRGLSPSYNSDASTTPARRQNPPQESRSPPRSPSSIYRPGGSSPSFLLVATAATGSPFDLARREGSHLTDPSKEAKRNPKAVPGTGAAPP